MCEVAPDRPPRAPQGVHTSVVVLSQGCSAQGLLKSLLPRLQNIHFQAGDPILVNPILLRLPRASTPTHLIQSSEQPHLTEEKENQSV